MVDKIGWDQRELAGTNICPTSIISLRMPVVVVEVLAGNRGPQMDQLKRG